MCVQKSKKCAIWCWQLSVVRHIVLPSVFALSFNTMSLYSRVVSPVIRTVITISPPQYKRHTIDPGRMMLCNSWKKGALCRVCFPENVKMTGAFRVE